METEIQNFFKNKRVFLTGATGFLGKVLIEKMLYATEVECIYAMVRPKRDRAALDRFHEIFNDVFFDKLKQLKPNAMERMKPIYGDCCDLNLGLSDEDSRTIIENVDIVLHCAATVRFNEPLSKAIQINVRATMDVLKLAKKVQNLKAFVHVSTAYSYCPLLHIDEEFYGNRLNFNAEQICKLAEVLGSDKLNSMTSALLDDFPNTYTFTKALAEEAVLSLGKDLPICVFRPGIIAPSCEGPITGWIDNLYGPTSILYGAAHGVLRVVLLGLEMTASLLPVDFCANLMLASAWNIGKNTSQELLCIPPIYNFVPENKNCIKWKNYVDVIHQYRYALPIVKMIWYPFAFCTKSKFFYTILWFIFQTIPGYFIDFLLKMKGKKPMMTKLYKKINVQMKLLHYFSITSITFTTTETRKMWDSLTPEDQVLFNFDMATIKWPEYLYNSLYGMRIFLGKENPETIPLAKKKMRIFELIHYGMITVFVCLIAFLIKTFLF